MGTLKTSLTTPSNRITIGPEMFTAYATVKLKGRAVKRRADHAAEPHKATLQEIRVASDGTPPVDIDASKLLADVAGTLDQTLAGCSYGFRKFYHTHMSSTAAKSLLVDSFWYTFTSMFDRNGGDSLQQRPTSMTDQTDLATGGHLPAETKVSDGFLTVLERLHRRLARTFAMFCYGLPAGRHKDFFLQYFPYIIVNAIEAAFRSYFPAAGHLYTPNFLERVHSLICTLFVHNSGPRHSQMLRGALRNKLFCPPHGRGPPPPPLPPLEATMARVPRDWQDIVLDDSGRYVVLASRGRGQNALGAAVYPTGRSSGRAGRSLSPGLFELEPSVSGLLLSKRTSLRRSLPDVSVQSSKSLRSVDSLADLDRKQTDLERPVFQIPGAHRMKPIENRPASAEFSLSNFRTSPLIGSYLSGHFDSPSSSDSRTNVHVQSSSKAKILFERSDAKLEPTSPVTGTAPATDLTHEPQERARTNTDGNDPEIHATLATEKTRKQIARAAERRQKTDCQTATNLASALGLDNDVTTSIGIGREAEQAYKRTTQLTVQAVNETKRECSKQKLKVDDQKKAILGGGSKKIKGFIHFTNEAKAKEVEHLRHRTSTKSNFGGARFDFGAEVRKAKTPWQKRTLQRLRRSGLLREAIGDHATFIFSPRGEA